MLKCTVCRSDIPDTEEKCLTCGFHAGPPNVRASERDDEVRALDARYNAAIDRANANGYLPTLRRFDDAVKQSCAVINGDLRLLYLLVTSEKALYANYEGGVAGRLRKPAALHDDLSRRGIGGSLFGGYAIDIIYAALSLDGSGPTSYGPYAIRLRDIAVRSRATVLENNSFDFLRKHKVAPGDRPPPGYVAPWEGRNRLAVAKLADYITPQTVDAEFPQLLLASTGNRATDEFIEVHICGTFDLNAIESVKGTSKLGSRDDRDLLRMIKQHLSRAGKLWIEG
jgi:hypothetical protein